MGPARGRAAAGHARVVALMAAVLPPPGGPGLPGGDDPYAEGRRRLNVPPDLDAVELTEIGEDTMELNMGPQHPSTHGVLRLVLDLDGEVVRNCRPDIGFLHTGFEKDFERHTYQQCIPYSDRMDYLAPLINNLGFSLAAEKLLGVEVPPRGQYLRVIMCELARIGSHLIWFGTHALDMGATTPFLYAWRERETILDINELVSGVRMHTSFIRVGGLMADVPDEFEAMVRQVVHTFPKAIDEYELLITKNPIWRERTQGLGTISADDALAYGMSGPSLRGSGVAYDLRKAQPYSSYDHFDFDVPVGTNGDVYDRYLVRMQEMRESLRIIEQALANLPSGPVNTLDRKVAPPPRNEINTSMESLIHHFKLVTEGFSVPRGQVYQAVESPRGELGFYMVSDGSNRPYRVKVRAPSFSNLHALPYMVKGELIADVVAVIGSIDIVLGDVDR
jgi:NADH-quinone oxidoreductase subunit D